MGSEPGSLKEIPSGTRIFIDANIFVYHFTGVSRECTQLLERCEREEVLGVTGAHILLEVLHRLMMIEAVVEGLVSPGGVARKLRRKPRLVRRLHRYQEQVMTIPGIGIEVVPIGVELIELSGRYRREYGLLVNDSLTLAVAEKLELEGLATADRDILRLSGKHPLRLFSPRDLGGTAQG